MTSVAVLSFHTSPLAQPGMGDGGGMNVYVRELSVALARAGVECDVYTRAWRRGLSPLVEVEPGFRVHHIAAGAGKATAKEDLPGLADEFTAGVLARMERHGLPTVLHANYWLSGLSGHTLKHELELPLVSTFHTLARVKAEGDGTEEANRADAESAIIGCSDTVLASSAGERDQLERLYTAMPTQVEIVPPGVDHDRFRPGDRVAARVELGLPIDTPVLLFVGRIQPLKGAQVAVAALPHVPHATLVVVGGPSGREGEAELRRLRQLASELGVSERVWFVLPQPHTSLPAYYRAADVCLVPSRSESFGLVALEAAACGTPVVASAVGGLATLVDHGRTGYLVEGRQPEAFARRVNQLLADPALAATMGVAASARARVYSWSITAARLRRLYGDLGARTPTLARCVGT